MSKEHQTNVEFIVEAMTFSKVGTLIQSIVLEGLSNYTKHIIENEEKVKETFTFISGESWIEGCKELNEKIEKHLKPDILRKASLSKDKFPA